MLQCGAGQEALPCCSLFIGPRRNADLGQLDALQPEGDCQMVLVRKEQKKKPNPKWKVPVLHHPLVCVVLGIGVPFLNPKLEGTARK